MTSDIGVTAPVDHPTAATSRSAWRAVWIVAIVVVASIGALLRIWAIGRVAIDADAAVVGLMAREILHGHFFAFYWGQRYGGVEPYAVAIMFAIFGQSSFTLAFTPIVLDAIAAILIWRIGRRVFSNEIGIAAALLFWVWPEVDVWQSTIEHGFRFAALCCGLGLLLVALRMTDGSTQSVLRRRLDAGAFGALVGLGFWASPEIAYYLVPAGALIVWRVVERRYVPRLGEVVLGGVTAVIGALPWIVDNVRNGFSSFAHAPQPSHGNPAIDHGKVLAGHVLPMMAGFVLRGFGHWIFPTAFGVVLYVLVLGAGLYWLVSLIRRREALVIVVGAIVFPLIYVVSPFTWYWADGRYGLYFAPLESLLVAAGAAAGWSWLARRDRFAFARRFPAGARMGLASVLCLGLALTIYATFVLPPYQTNVFPPLGRTGLFTWHADPAGYASKMSRLLQTDGVHDAYAGYWVAYLLSFESRGAITASDVRYERYRPYLDAIEHSRDPTWIFENPDHVQAARALVGSSELDPGCAALTDPCLSASDFEHYLSQHHDRFEVREISYFLAVTPASRVDPDVVFRHFAIPTTSPYVATG